MCGFSAVVGDDDNAAIRPHALGKFRDLLGTTARHPGMLRDFDKTRNAANHIDENYTCELMERHTLGGGGDRAVLGGLFQRVYSLSHAQLAQVFEDVAPKDLRLVWAVNHRLPPDGASVATLAVLAILRGPGSISGALRAVCSVATQP